MKAFFSILLFITLSSYQSVAQADCSMLCRYKGSITSDSITVSRIDLPTVSFLCSYIKAEDAFAFSRCELKDSIINKMIVDFGSQFCGDYENIINNIFKKKDGYIIRLYEKQNNNRIELLIPLDSIKFSIELIDGNKEIVIDLGKIKFLKKSS